MLGALVFIHQRFAVALIAFAVLLGLWGLLLLARRQAPTGGYRSSYLLMAMLTGLQGLLGIGAFLAGGSPREGFFHIVYGIFAFFFLPGVFVYSGRRQPVTETMLLTIGSWVVAIAYVRGLTTG